MRGYRAALVVAALAAPAISAADAPKGHYDVRTVRAGTFYDDAGKLLKPCGRAAHDHLRQFRRANITYGSSTIVNDHDWIQDPAVHSKAKDRGEVAMAHEHPVDHAEYQTLVTFYAMGKRR